MSDEQSAAVAPPTTPAKRRGRKELPPLPCGCPARTGQGRLSAMLMEDGSRVCREHSRRWEFVWREILVPAQA
jgi:hypothetical protein